MTGNNPFVRGGTDQREKLAKACHDDAPNSLLDRWRSLCLGGLLQVLLGGGRDVTVLIGRKTDRARGDFDVVLSEERQ